MLFLEINTTPPILVYTTTPPHFKNRGMDFLRGVMNFMNKCIPLTKFHKAINTYF